MSSDRRPMPVAATFAFPRDDGATLGDLARLDTMVTVVDAANFLPEPAGGDGLAERGLDQYEDDERTVSDLLIDQIEFADVIVVNKLDLVGEDQAARLRAALTRLNPVARIVSALHGRVDPADILGTGRFDLERAQQAPGWVMELNGDHVPETEEYGISSTVFRADRPFHPGRLWEFVTEGLDSGGYGQVLRSKGFFSLAGRGPVTGLWSQAGAVAGSSPPAPTTRGRRAGRARNWSSSAPGCVRTRCTPRSTPASWARTKRGRGRTRSPHGTSTPSTTPASTSPSPILRRRRGADLDTGARRHAVLPSRRRPRPAERHAAAGSRCGRGCGPGRDSYCGVDEVPTSGGDV